MYGYICPECGAHLDPGEKCDCFEERIWEAEAVREQMKELSKQIVPEKNGQLRLAV